VILVKNARFFYDGEKIHENVDVVIDGEDRAETCTDKSDVVVDGRGKLLLPAFLNAHAHLPMVVMRGFHEDMYFHPWLASVWRVEEKLTPEIVYHASVVSIAENLRGGVTSAVSMYFFYEETARAVEDFGLPYAVGPVFVDDENMEERLSAAESFFKRKWRHAVPTVFSHAPYSCSPETLGTVAEIREKYGVPHQVHVSETREEVVSIKRKYSRYPVEYLDEHTPLDEGTTLVHCGWLTKGELDLISRKGAALVHCPSSNAKLATHGFFPWKEAVQRGVKILMGTDSQVSNNAQDMFMEMRMAALTAKDRYWDATVAPVREVLNAVRGPGWILVDVSGLRFFPQTGRNILANVVFNGHSDLVTHVFLRGEVKYPFNSELREKVETSKEFLLNALTTLYPIGNCGDTGP